MADVVGSEGLHSVKGYRCDLCSRECDPEAEEINALDCSYSNCPADAAVYHQDCLEKYLKSVKLEKNRKTGFRCPRGTGKGSQFQACPGRIEKSHPIHKRNDGAKKRRKAQMPAQLPDIRPRMEPTERNKSKDDDARKEKEKKAAEELQAKASAKPVKEALSKEEMARQEKVRLQAAAYAAKRDMGLTSDTSRHSARHEKPSHSGTNSTASVAIQRSAPRSWHTLGEYESGQSPAKSSRSPGNAWGSARSDFLAAAEKDAAWGSGSLPGRAPPPPPPRRIIPAPQKPLGPSLKLTAVNDKPKSITVGMATSPKREDPTKLSKAQRKNLKRLEKKAAERSTEKMSVASSEMFSEADMANIDFDGILIPAIEEETIFTAITEDCTQAITLFKAQSLIAQLQTLGFPDWQCVPAVMAHGTDLEAAVTYLLEGNVSSEEHARQLLGSAASLPQIDITPEMAQLQQAKEESSASLVEIQDEVIRQMGNVDKACRLLQLRHSSSPSTQHESSPPHDDGDTGFQWGKTDDGEDEGDFGSIQSEFTNLEIDPGTGALWTAPSSHLSQQSSQHDRNLQWQVPDLARASGQGSISASQQSAPESRQDSNLSHYSQLFASGPSQVEKMGAGQSEPFFVFSHQNHSATDYAGSWQAQGGVEGPPAQAEAAELDIDHLLGSLLAQ